MKDLDVFIQGEIMDLCIPTEEFALGPQWYSWRNKKDVTKYLEHNLFPNTPKAQAEFFNSQKTERLILIISNKTTYMGVISLSSVNLKRKTCDVALAVDNSLDRKLAPYIALEAMARITEHAFEVIGINRIGAGQHIDLRGWQQRMELLGYKLEGLHVNKFIKGREVNNTVSIACIYEDFQQIKSNRGSLWDSIEKMRIRCEALPKTSFSDTISKLFETDRKLYYDQILSL